MIEHTINLRKEYELMKNHFPSLEEGRLWQYAAENFALKLEQRDITFSEFFDSLCDRVERYFESKK